MLPSARARPQYRTFLGPEHFSEWEKVFNPQDFYASVAGLYEAAYGDANGISCSARSRNATKVKFVWRLAAETLLAMKKAGKKLQLAGCSHTDTGE